MDTGLQIALLVIIVAGLVAVVFYQRWKRTSQTQIDIDTRFHDDEEPIKED